MAATGDRLIPYAMELFCEALMDGFVAYQGRTWYVDGDTQGHVVLIAFDGLDDDPPTGLTLDPGAVLCAVAAGELRGAGEPAA
ncbi:hypothetical protein BH24ACI5_BH24ACI5_24920 [soil metagenome]